MEWATENKKARHIVPPYAYSTRSMQIQRERIIETGELDNQKDKAKIKVKIRATDKVLMRPFKGSVFY